MEMVKRKSMLAINSESSGFSRTNDTFLFKYLYLTRGKREEGWPRTVFHERETRSRSQRAPVW